VADAGESCGLLIFCMMPYLNVGYRVVSFAIALSTKC